jgi:hypothetical protein
MAHAIVAVHDRHRRRLPLDADIRPHIHRSGFDAPDVLRQPENAVPFGTVHVGTRHQRGDHLCVAGRHIDGFESARDESFEVWGFDAELFSHARCQIVCAGSA